MKLETITSITKNIPSSIKGRGKSIWNTMVHASFRKVVVFDLLFLALGIAIGAGLSAAFFTENIFNLIAR